MTNQERITSHNNRLEVIKETVARLPDAGSESSMVETCTVTVTIPPYTFPNILLVYTSLENNAIIGKNVTIDSTTTITMLKNSVLSIIDNSAVEGGTPMFGSMNISVNNGDILRTGIDGVDFYVIYSIALITSDGTITITAG